MISDRFQQPEHIYFSDRCNVYKAIDRQDQRPVVIKELLSGDPGRLHNELKICREVDGDTKAGILLSGNNPAFVRTYKDGKTIHHLLQNQPLDLSVFFRVSLAAVAALNRFHRFGLLHKDITPFNLLFDEKTSQVFLLDFELSTYLQSNELSLSPVGFIEGTLNYISPEQTGRMNRRLDYRSDYYALGATFYEMLCHQPPFVSDDPLTLVHHHLATSPAIPHEHHSHIPPAVSAIVLKLLAKNAEDRYQSLEGLQKDLERCQEAWVKGEPQSWFEPGKMDVNTKLNISQQLFGRDKESERLQQAYESTTQGAKIIVALGGIGGVGKSRLVQELHKSVTGSKGLLLTGHFDPLQRQIPFIAWVQAFDQFTEWVLAESKQKQEYWRNTLKNALQGLEDILTEFVPRLARLWGEQPKRSELTGNERQQGLIFALNAFIKCLSQPDHPLILFLEDWHWADEASIGLLNSIATGEEITHLLLVASYRDNETGVQHPFSVALQEIEKRPGQYLQHLSLQNLHEVDISHLLARSLGTDAEQIQPLTHVLFAKTHGNAFAVNNFIQAIYKEKLLFFDFNATQWKWDLENIRRRYLHDDVADMIIKRLTQNGEVLLHSLKAASAIGLEFSVGEVAQLEVKSDEMIHKELWPLIQEGWLIPKNNNYRYIPEFYSEQGIKVVFSFAHARIQQAIYDQLDEDQRMDLHFRLGQSLLTEHKSDFDSLPNDRLFSIARHISISYQRFTDKIQQQQLVQILRTAGERAYKNAAFDVALIYLEQTLPFLKTTLDERALADFFSILIQCTQLSGRDKLRETYTHEALGIFKQDWERSVIYEAQIKCYIWAGETVMAVEVANKALYKLGIKLPAKASTLQVIWSIIVTNLKLPDSKVSQISQRPPVSDEKALLTLRLLNTSLAPYFFINRSTYPLLITQIVQLAVKYGVCQDVILGFASYGLVTSGVLKKPERGYQIGQQVGLFLERFPSDFIKASVCFTNALFVTHWKHDWRETQPILREGYLSGLRSGNMEYASWNWFLSSAIQFMMGTSLKLIHQNVQETLSFQKQYGQLNQIKGTLILLRKTEQIADISPTVSKLYDSTEIILASLHEGNYSVDICIYHFYENLFWTVTEEWERAWEEALKGWKYREALVSTITMCSLTFYGILAGVNRAGQLQGKAQKEIKTKVKQMLQVLDLYTKLNPITRSILYDFAQLQATELLGGTSDTKADYSTLTQKCLQYDFHLVAAIAATQHGRQLLREKNPQSTIWFRQAEEIYNSQDAKAFARFVRQKYLSGASTGYNSGQSLDTATLVKMASSLSSEIKLDRLLEQLMRYAVENAGAERGLFILLRNDTYLAELELRAAQEGQFRFLRQPIENSELLAETVVNYAFSTGQAVVVDDAVKQSPFNADPYIQRHQSKSILCLPFAHQNIIKGLIYLENNLATEVFNRQRVELLTLLAGQVGVSIENAMLYENLENLVKKRTEQLEAEKMKSDGLLRNILPDQIADELKMTGRSEARHYPSVSVLFADIENFTGYAERQNPTDLVEELDYYFKMFDALIEKYPIEKIKTIGDAYFCAGGLPIANTTHAHDLVQVALDIQEWMEQEAEIRQREGTHFFRLRIGIHTGPVVAGVVGSTKFAYDIWGDTVNTGARIEQNGAVGKVNISQATYELVKQDFDCEYRGEIQAKNKGGLKMYYVNRRQSSGVITGRII